MEAKNKILLGISALCFGGVFVMAYINRKKITQEIKGVLNMEFFSIDELCASSTAKKYDIDNTPTEAIKQNLTALINRVLDPVRRLYGSYILIKSGYRCIALNAKVGGVSTSQHTKGQAADITGGSVSKNRIIFQKIIENGQYDQLIWEKGGSWIHVSFCADGQNRKQILNYNGSAYADITNNWKNTVLTA